jgi:hypothetical protein
MKERIERRYIFARGASDGRRPWADRRHQLGTKLINDLLENES